MGAITMQSTRSLATKLQSDFHDYQFREAGNFRWSPDDRTIYYMPGSDTQALLHELAHAELKHVAYARDILLLAMERDAWLYARTRLAPLYGIKMNEDDIQDSLDTYRDWLHKRSTCPNCEATGIQIKRHSYRCLACESVWQVNDARACALRRRLEK